MRLATRFFVLGALLPSLATLAALLVATEVFRAALESSLDRALLSQAAIEAVSLFDGPGGGPHLHMATSPLEAQVRSFAPVGEVFDARGELVVRHPPGAGDPPERVLPGDPDASPVLETIHLDGARRRVLSLSVQSPRGPVMLLRLTASLAQIDASVATFRRVTLAFALGLAAFLAAVQGVQSRRLARRLERLTTHVTALREGRLEQDPPPDSGRDEVGVMRDALADATVRLRDAREAEHRLVADAAHELRTPLTLMRTQLDLALRRQRSPEELRTALEETRQEVNRLSHLATHLLDLQVAGRGEWDRRAVDVRQLVEEAIEGARTGAEQRRVVISVAPGPAVSALVAGEPLRQALDNLLSNALRYAPPASAIEVEVARRGERLLLAVSDAGAGIPESEREAVFAPFHRVPGTQGGAGLGLSIVREIARRHGGEARIRSSAAGGARVELDLPAT